MCFGTRQSELERRMRSVALALIQACRGRDRLRPLHFIVERRREFEATSLGLGGARPYRNLSSAGFHDHLL